MSKRDSYSHLIRLHQVLQILSISESTWWEGVGRGEYPQPIKLEEGLTCWRLDDVLKLTKTGAE